MAEKLSGIMKMIAKFSPARTSEKHPLSQSQESSTHQSQASEKKWWSEMKRQTQD
jgi:hypothetical protein